MAASAFLQEKAEVEKVFNRFDANRDGKISATELVNVMNVLGSDTSDEEVARMMSEIDSDRDGFISLDEFSAFLSCSAPDGGDDGDRELRDAFSLYDQNKNGLISSVELHQILNKVGETCTVQDCAKMIQTVDSDGDGHVSFEEFKKMMSNNAASANGSAK